MLVAVLLFIAFVYFVILPDHKTSLTATKSQDAEELLKVRFVRGEIDEDTYQSMLRTLRSS